MGIVSYFRIMALFDEVERGYFSLYVVRVYGAVFRWGFDWSDCFRGSFIVGIFFR